jgi:hypothetical protein
VHAAAGMYTSRIGSSKKGDYLLTAAVAENRIAFLSSGSISKL